MKKLKEEDAARGHCTMYTPAVDLGRKK